ncbi:GNAT family N-acetyltransferase [Paraburkholderia sp. Ac-20336]|uniref:GNAT family N-acetyltransferase n=1 Tax=Paraburkholderia sp. Ac-20336 TaxID=2703886 RepID=UPI00197F3EDF|nr:GNAT family N-acetyltransferase [Paraburkholderia sp. Ac-20336]MBN3804057.1 GNAT family N-acetyltransferase [Paraburkholderia sp. Ac-20336]
MNDSLRTVAADGAHYVIVFEKARVSHVIYRWPPDVDARLGEQIVELMRHTSQSAPIIGFAEAISDTEAEHYLVELRANLAAQKCRLLAILADNGTLIGLCTLRRNLNPNNRHITDLAKGMIHEAFRGGGVLPAAFVEIALQCEADGVELVTLDVRADTPAYRVWDHFGFQTYGVLPDYARAQGKTHAGHFMMQKVADLKARSLGMLQARVADSPRSGAQAA